MRFQRLEDLRIDADKTQEEIANILDCKREVYRRYEKGVYEIPVWALIKLSEYYQVSTDYDLEIDLKILLDTLQTDSPALPKELNDKLFYTILEDYEDIPTKAGKMKKMKVDPHYNVVQVKYAYAVTCHKAQGGQWMNVFLDIGYITEEMLGEDFYRWLYTAFTRATHHLYLVNLPDEFVE